MRLCLWKGLLGSGLWLSGLSVVVTGCTTEAACFQECSDEGSTETGGTGGKSTGTGGSIMIGLGGDDSPGTGMKPGAGGGGMVEDAGTECDTVDLDTDVNNCGTCGV